MTFRFLNMPRDDLNMRVQRVFGVLILQGNNTNYPSGRVEEMEIINNPEDITMGSRKVPFSNEIYIELTISGKSASEVFRWHPERKSG